MAEYNLSAPATLNIFWSEHFAFVLFLYKVPFAHRLKGIVKNMKQFNL